MPRGVRASNKTPESGYKWDCDYCEGEIFQAQQPELVIAIEEAGSGRSRSYQSVCYQACVECAIEIKAENKKYEAMMNAPQVRPVKNAEELAPILAPTSTDAKLDKVVDAIGALVQLMTLQMQGKVPAKPVSNKKLPPAKKAPIPKPKRAILAPPVKKNASKPKKPAALKAAPRKQKPGSKR